MIPSSLPDPHWSYSSQIAGQSSIGVDTLGEKIEKIKFDAGTWIQTGDLAPMTDAVDCSTALRNFLFPSEKTKKDKIILESLSK